MTHIEHDSDPWVPPSPKPVNLLTSAVEVLKSSLGEYWQFKVFLLVVGLLTPSIVFSLAHKIEFEPAEFVTLWLHLSIEGIFFFFILEIVRHRSLSFTAHESMVRFLTRNYEQPVQVLLVSIKDFRNLLCDRTGDLPATVKSAWRNWSIIKTGLSDEALRHLPGSAALEVWSMRNDLRPTRCGDLLGSILGANNPSELDNAEYTELLTALENFLNSIKHLHA